MRNPEFPEPSGVYRCIDQPMYDKQLNEQIETARQKQGPGDLNEVFNAGDTWSVS